MRKRIAMFAAAASLLAVLATSAGAQAQGYTCTVTNTKTGNVVRTFSSPSDVTGTITNGNITFRVVCVSQ